MFFFGNLSLQNLLDDLVQVFVYEPGNVSIDIIKSLK